MPGLVSTYFFSFTEAMSTEIKVLAYQSLLGDGLTSDSAGDGMLVSTANLDRMRDVGRAAIACVLDTCCLICVAPLKISSGPDEIASRSKALTRLHLCAFGGCFALGDCHLVIGRGTSEGTGLIR